MNSKQVKVEILNRLFKAYSEPQDWEMFGQHLAEQVENLDLEGFDTRAVLEDLSGGNGWIELDGIRDGSLRRMVLDRYGHYESDSPWEVMRKLENAI